MKRNFQTIKFRMKITELFFFIILINFFLIYENLAAQKKSEVKLLNADISFGSVIKNETVRNFEGNVRFENEGSLLFADKVAKYELQGFLEAVSKVKLIDKGVTLTSEYMKYFPDQKFSQFQNKVHLISESSELFSNFGTYDMTSQEAVFWGKTKLLDKDLNEIYSDTLFHDRKTAHSILKENVRIISPKDRTVITGDYSEYFANDKFSFVERNPFFYQLPDSGKKDTFFIIGNRMESFQGEQRKYSVFGNVRVLNGDMSAKSDTLIILRNENLMKLRKNPVVWYGKNQISGDSINIQFTGNQLKKIDCFGSAMTVSSIDSFPNKYNQLKGKNITYLFENRLITRIDVFETSESLYHMDEDGEPSGANLASGDFISIFFKEGEVDKIKVSSGVEGKFMPESMITKDPVYLRGFFWASKERPVLSEMRNYVR